MGQHCCWQDGGKGYTPQCHRAAGGGVGSSGPILVRFS